MENIFHANGKQKEPGATVLVSDEIDLKIKITRDKEEHNIVIKGSLANRLKDSDLSYSMNYPTPP